MMAFWAICILLILLALALVLPPLLRREDASDPRRVALEHAHRSGVLDADEYTRKLAALGNTTPTSISPLARNTAIAIAWISLLARRLRRSTKAPVRTAQARCCSIPSTTAAKPLPEVATVLMTGGRHRCGALRSPRLIMWRRSRTVASAPSRSALLTTNTSPISRIPAFAA